MGESSILFIYFYCRIYLAIYLFILKLINLETANVGARRLNWPCRPAPTEKQRPDIQVISHANFILILFYFCIYLCNYLFNHLFTGLSIYLFIQLFVVLTSRFCSGV